MAIGIERINALWHEAEVSLICFLAVSLLVFATHAHVSSEASLAHVALIMSTIFSFAVLMSFLTMWRVRMEHIIIMTTASKWGRDGEVLRNDS